MRRCPRCVAFVDDELTICPTCQLPASARIVDEPFVESSDAEEIPPEPVSLISVSQKEPDLRTPWAKRSREAEFIVGTGTALVVGLYLFIWVEWLGGLIFMVCSPFTGLLLACFYGSLADLFQVYLYKVGGSDRVSFKRKDRRIAKMLEIDSEPSTDITTRTTHVIASPTTCNPSVTPTETLSETDPLPEVRAISRQGKMALTFWFILLVCVASSVHAASVSNEDATGIVTSGLCCGLPVGFLLSTLALLLFRMNKRT